MCESGVVMGRLGGGVVVEGGMGILDGGIDHVGGVGVAAWWVMDGMVSDGVRVVREGGWGRWSWCGSGGVVGRVV